ncbi:hypothetical protein BC831DRAFT_428656 [Entophlyctis helioformis]|nr:hypothetical protein BC831DRAFT_428656 [Entophlyctis helioformis]
METFNGTSDVPQMGAKELGWANVGIASLLLVVNGLISIYFGLGLEVDIIVAALRCIVQLTLLSVALEPVFAVNQPLPVFAIASLLVLIACSEVYYSRTAYRHQYMFFSVLVSIMASTFMTGFIGNAFAIQADPWWSARNFIPTMGMLVGNAMSSVAVGLSSVTTQLVDNKDKIEMYLSFGASRWEAARPVCVEAIKLALLPALNSMSIIGLVSIPGMMTGQILGGSSAENAAHYQQVITFMITSSCSLATVTAVLAAVFMVFDDKARLRLDLLVKNKKRKSDVAGMVKRTASSLWWAVCQPGGGSQPRVPCRTRLPFRLNASLFSRLPAPSLVFGVLSIHVIVDLLPQYKL